MLELFLQVMSGKPDSWPATGNTLLLGDPGILLRAVGAVEFAYVKGEEELFCAKYGLREKVCMFYPTQIKRSFFIL